MIRFRLAGRPIVAVAAQPDDPLLRVGIGQEHIKPAAIPRTRRKRAGRFVFRSLVVEQGNEVIGFLDHFIGVAQVERLARGHADPKFPAVLVQCVGEVAHEVGDLVRVSGIDLLPVKHDPAARAARKAAMTFWKNFSCRGAAADARFSIASGCQASPRRFVSKGMSAMPCEAASFGRRLSASICKSPQPVYHCHPFRADVRDLPRVLLERGVTVGVAVAVERQMHLARAGSSRERGRRGRHRFLGGFARGAKPFPERNLRRRRRRRGGRVHLCRISTGLSNAAGTRVAAAVE